MPTRLSHVTAVLLLFAFASTAAAQGLFDKLKDVVEDTVEKTVDEAVQPEESAESADAQHESVVGNRQLSDTNAVEIDIYGLTLAMSPEEVISVLKSKHEFREVEMRGSSSDRNARSRNRDENRNSTRNTLAINEKQQYLDRSSSYVQSIVATISDVKENERYVITIEFSEELPPSAGVFATSINFRHRAVAFDFSPRQFARDKFGDDYGTALPYKDGFAVTGVTEASQYYDLNIFWRGEDRKRHEERLEQIRKERQTKADKPF